MENLLGFSQKTGREEAPEKKELIEENLVILVTMVEYVTREK
jgi:hypothetical protein